MNYKNISFFKLSFLLLCFVILYNQINNDSGRYILILMILPISLLIEHINMKLFLIITSACIIISAFTFGLISYETFIIEGVYLSCVPGLLLFSAKGKLKINDSIKRKNDELKFYKEELSNERESLIAEREKLEKKLERITHFYIISKDLNKNIYTPKNIANTVLNILSSRPGVKYCLITRKLKNIKDNTTRLQIFSRLNEDKKRQWYKMINNNPETENMKKPVVLKSLFDIEQKAIVAWPVNAGVNWDFCIYMVVEPEYSKTYLEEGYIFIPNLKLSAKRIALFFELKEKSRIDGLTGLYLKRYFIEKLNSEIERVKRYNTGFYLMMLDIDFFKKINDNYGHLTGDKVLKEIAEIISSTVRSGDIVSRYGGEEFIAILPSISRKSAFEIAEKIRKTTENKIFEDNNKKFKVTVSIGICKYIENAKAAELIDNADKALYEAKESGRNRTVNYNL